MKKLDELISYLKSKDNVWLYGAGKISGRIISLCKKYNIDVDGIIITERDRSPYVIEGINVYTLAELEYKNIRHDTLNVVVSFMTLKQKSFDEFVNLNFASVLFLTSNIYRQLSLMDLQQHFNRLQNEIVLDAMSSHLEPGQGVLYEIKDRKPIMRFPLQDKGMLETLMKYGHREKTVEALGKWSNLPCAVGGKISEAVGEEEKIEIYVITSHFDNMILDEKISASKIYMPLQVGATLTNRRKGGLVDNSGENISSKNGDYSECTGLYWLWKNTSQQNYVGLNHYRRRLRIDDESIAYIRKNDIDVVVALPQLEVDTIKEFLLAHYIPKFDWVSLRNAIAESKPEWLKYFEKFEQGHFYYPCNVCLWKRKWFDKYCEFSFGVAEIIERENESRGLYRNDRYMGYLFECMATIFIIANNENLKVACTEIEWVE